jgi:hypothetical protein
MPTVGSELTGQTGDIAGLQVHERWTKVGLLQPGSVSQQVEEREDV